MTTELLIISFKIIIRLQLRFHAVNQDSSSDDVSSLNARAVSQVLNVILRKIISDITPLYCLTQVNRKILL